MDVTAYRDRLRKDFENHLLIAAKVQNRVKVTDDDVKGYYQSHLAEFTGEEQVKLRLILLAVPAGAPPAEDARVKATGETAAGAAGRRRGLRRPGPAGLAGPGRRLGRRPGLGEEGHHADRPGAGGLRAHADGQISGLIRARTGWIILKADERRDRQRPAARGGEETASARSSSTSRPRPTASSTSTS